MVKGKGRRTLHLLLPGCSLGLEALVPSRLGVRLNVGNFGEFLIFSIVADTAALRAFLLGVSTLPGFPATTCSTNNVSPKSIFSIHEFCYRITDVFQKEA